MQAAAGQQLLQAFIHAVLAVQALGLAASGQLRAEGQQHASLAAELVERGLQRPGGDVEALASAFGADFQAGLAGQGGQGGGQAEAQQQRLHGTDQGLAGEVAEAERVLHRERLVSELEGLCLPCHARSEKRLSLLEKIPDGYRCAQPHPTDPVCP
ncbi:hypothetical protein D3C84_866770 [compost metagenome]